MTFSEAIRSCFARYATFTGRAARPEFWYFVLFTAIVQIVIAIVTLGSDTLSNTLTSLFGLAVLLPSLAVGARRLHDTDRSGWWQLIHVIPLIGLVVLIYFFVQPGTGPNRFGEGAAGPA